MLFPESVSALLIKSTENPFPAEKGAYQKIVEKKYQDRHTKVWTRNPSYWTALVSKMC